jgi:hypothetical protein
MPKAVSIVSPFHNLSAGDLVDQLGAIKAEIAEREAREKALRDELIRRGNGEVEGADYRATVTDAVRWTLDTKAVRAEMGDAWFNARCWQALVTTVAVKPRTIDARLAA